MLKKIIEINSNRCTVIVSSSFSDIDGYFNKIAGEKSAVIITDEVVEERYGQILKKQLSRFFDHIFTYKMKSGETSKNLKVCYDIYSFMISANLKKEDFVIAFGGGVVGDVAGFIAATYKRGLKLIQVPTTFLAQIDSSIGGKNAINVENTKNVVGTFYQPELVYINYGLLKSLSHRDFMNGIVEVTVHGLIRDRELFELLEKSRLESMDDLKGYEEKFIMDNCNIKLSIVQVDEQDNGLRKILNFGHTIGHAIEGAYGFRYQHGECVAVGIAGAFIVGQKLGYTPEELVVRVIAYIKKLKIDIHLKDMDVDKVIERMECDKKNVQGYITFIVPIDIGKVEMIPLKDISCIKETLAQLTQIFS